MLFMWPHMLFHLRFHLLFHLRFMRPLSPLLPSLPLAYKISIGAWKESTPTVAPIIEN
jgi:hypothetical protein